MSDIYIPYDITITDRLGRNTLLPEIAKGVLIPFLVPACKGVVMPKQRSHGDGEIRQRPDGRWESRIRLPNGQRKSFYGRTRRDVQTTLKRFRQDIERGLSLANDKLTLGQYLGDWLDDVKGTLAYSTWKSYESYVRLHIVPQIGNIRLRNLSATHVNQVMRQMEESRLAPRSRNYARAVLRKALNDAVDSDLVASNAAAKARSVRQRSQQIGPLSPDEVVTLLKHTRNHWLGPLIHVAIATGLRQGELLGLRWIDVDFDGPSITVRNSLSRIDGTFQFTPPKTEKSARTVFLDPSAVQALRRQREQQEQAKLVAGDWEDWGLVFSTTKGTPQYASNVTHRVQKLMEAAGVPRRTFHNLRHSAASLLYANGADIKMIQEVLGHSQISLTANTYTHLGETMRREAASKMGVALSGLDN
jgi:integrase